MTTISPNSSEKHQEKTVSWTYSSQTSQAVSRKQQPSPVSPTTMASSWLIAISAQPTSSPSRDKFPSILRPCKLGGNEERSGDKIFQQEFLRSYEEWDVNTAWTAFKEHTKSLISKHVPTKTTPTRYSPPWITSVVKRLCKKQHRAYNKYKKSGTARARENFKNIKKECQTTIRRAHNEYVNNTLTESMLNKNSKPFWKYIKSKRQENIGVAPLLKQGKLHTDSTTKANILNEQFQSVFTKDAGNETPRLSGNVYHHINELHVTTKGVQKLLSNINPQKATGPDGIPGRILKELAPELAPCLSIIFEKSLTDGRLPDEWTKAYVTPIFKKGSKHAAVNYRPVSLTCICTKLMEHIVCHHIAGHLEEYNILTPYQHGFR